MATAESPHERDQRVTVAALDRRHLVEQPAREDDGGTGPRAVALVSDLGEPELAAEVPAVEVDRDGQSPVRGVGRGVVAVRLEPA